MKKERHEHLGWQGGEYISCKCLFWKWTTPSSTKITNIWKKLSYMEIYENDKKHIKLLKLKLKWTEKLI